MNATRWIGIVAVGAAAAGLMGMATANEAELTPKSDQSQVDLDSNSAAQLGWDKSSAQQRRGDSSARHGSDNSAAQMGSGVNANPGAQLDNETPATSTPPADSDRGTAEQPVKSHPDHATSPDR